MKTRTTVTFYVAMAVICIGIFAFGKYEEKKYTVEYTQPQWESRYSWVAVAKTQLLRSNLPINEIKPLTDSLDKFLSELSAQIVPQMKPATDSTKKKK